MAWGAIDMVAATWIPAFTFFSRIHHENFTKNSGFRGRIALS